MNFHCTRVGVELMVRTAWVGAGAYVFSRDQDPGGLAWTLEINMLNKHLGDSDDSSNWGNAALGQTAAFLNS